MQCSQSSSDIIYDYLHVWLNNETPFLTVDKKKKSLCSLPHNNESIKKQARLFEATISELNRSTKSLTPSDSKKHKKVIVITNIFFLSIKQMDDIDSISHHKNRLATALQEHLESHITSRTLSESRRRKFSLSRVRSTSSSSHSSHAERVTISTCSSSSGESPHLQRSIRGLDLTRKAYNYYLLFWFNKYGQEKPTRALARKEGKLRASGEYAIMEQHGLFANKSALARMLEKQVMLPLHYTNWDSLGLDIARNIKTIILLDHNKDELFDFNWGKETQDVETLFNKQIKYFNIMLMELMDYASIEKELQLTTLQCWQEIVEAEHPNCDNKQQHFGSICGAFLKALASGDPLPNNLLPLFQAMAQANYMFPFRIIKRVFDNVKPQVVIPQKGQGQLQNLYHCSTSFILNPAQLTVQAMESVLIPSHNKIPACQLIMTNVLSSNPAHLSTTWKAKLEVEITTEDMSKKKIKRIESRLITPLTNCGFKVSFNEKIYDCRKTSPFHVDKTITEDPEETGLEKL